MATSWFNIVPHTMRKGETLASVLKARGFPTSAVSKIFKAPYNSKLRKERGDPKSIEPGDVVHIPSHSKATIKTMWENFNDIFWGADEALGVTDLRKKIAEIEANITDLETSISDMKAIYYHGTDKLRKSAETCRKRLAQEKMQIGAMALCVTEVVKWAKVQEDANKAFSGRLAAEEKKWLCRKLWRGSKLSL
ncbi:hypothetical protein [Ruegeria hyattellae]|uniref:hypothetical protein n=1 Tax=Ruegeria hyattellae TaxID=3233337 RepID=UPI00355BAEF1